MKLNMYLGKKHPVGLSELVLIITAANVYADFAA